MEKLIRDLLLMDSMIMDNREQMSEVMYQNYAFHMKGILKRAENLANDIERIRLSNENRHDLKNHRKYHELNNLKKAGQ